VTDDVKTASDSKRGNPFVGPRSLQRGEPLFGRSWEVAELFDLLIAERIVLMYSPSGAGKTSLIQAGLLPRLEAKGFQIRGPMRVGHAESVEVPDTPANPITVYERSVVLSLEQAKETGDRRPASELAAITLKDYLTASAPPPSDGGRRAGEVLIFDQFEEVLKRRPADIEGKHEFFRQIGEVLREQNRWALFAIREDNLGGLDPYLNHVPTRLMARFRLELLRPEEAREAIEETARLGGIPFGADAAPALVKNLSTINIRQPDGKITPLPGPFIEPVQLQVVCWNIWETLPPGTKEIGVGLIGDVGTVDAALIKYYDKCVTDAVKGTNTTESTLRRWIETLISLRGTRAQGEIPDNVDDAAVRSLGDRYLLRADERPSTVWYELAHDRLIGPVQSSNSEWFRENAGIVQQQANLWESRGRDDDYLLQREELGDAQRWVAAHPGELDEAGRDFIRISLDRQRWSRRLRAQALRIASFAGGLAILGIAAFFVVRKERETLTKSFQASSDTFAKLYRSKTKEVDSVDLLNRELGKRITDTYRAESTGVPLDNSRINQSIQATLLLDTITKRDDAASPERALTEIKYFAKEVDGSKVQQTLVDLGFHKVDVRDARAPEAPTNFVAYGSAVPDEDVRVVTLALIRAGVPIKRVCPFTDSRGREHEIEVLGRRLSQNDPPLTVEQVRNATRDDVSRQCQRNSGIVGAADTTRLRLAPRVNAPIRRSIER